MAIPRSVLFIPVSGPSGMGEAARCVAIAQALCVRWPALQVHFALSAAAPYLAQVPFPSTLFPSSPTFHPREVGALIRSLRPTVVVFDNAGRTTQLQAAHEVGARIVYVSSRRRQRGKAFRLRWMRLLDDHWIAYPSFIAGATSAWERLKLRLLGRPNLRYLDALLPAHDAALAATVGARFGLATGDYVLVVPGGGTTHRGALHSPATVAQAAALLAAAGVSTLLVGAEPAAPDGALRTCGRLPVAELCELIRGARLVIVNGGDTLLQVLACRRACIAVPMAGDQAHRIACCARDGLALAGAPDAAGLAAQALALLGDSEQLVALESALARAALANSLDSVVTRLGELGLGGD
ncbi:MAG: hypothetical protein WCH32_12965 [Pseudomonadota bacterium]